ncbi:MAG TPA: hypothetical protein VEF33_02340 [Syntrophales bacterium]|nr:hypothetical protein [Syntrophales bacterium]
MRLKNIVLMGIFVLYAGYYIGVSKGFIKKHSGQEGRERSFIQQVIDVITPMSPEERRIELNERLDTLKMHLTVAEENLANYERWRSHAISNPPS